MASTAQEQASGDSSAINRRLCRAARNACRDLTQLCHERGEQGSELRSKFLGAVGDIESVAIAPLPTSCGSFEVRDGQLIVADEPVGRLVEYVRASVIEAEALPAGSVNETLEGVFVGFVLHELRHRTQGVEQFGTVADARLAGGNAAIAELDLLADRDAAFAAAALKRGKSRQEFLLEFRAALYLSMHFYFRVFPPHGERTDKIARALGVLLMTARLTGIDDLPNPLEDPALRLDIPLVAQLSVENMRLAVYRGEPHRQLLAVANDEHDELSRAVVSIRAGDFDQALSWCITFAKRTGLLCCRDGEASA